MNGEILSEDPWYYYCSRNHGHVTERERNECDARGRATATVVMRNDQPICVVFGGSAEAERQRVAEHREYLAKNAAARDHLINYSTIVVPVFGQ